MMKFSTGIKLAALATGVVAISAIAQASRKSQEFKFKNKVVLITGGSRGLGLILARKLGESGARIAICARTVEQLERAELELVGRGINVLAIVCDVTDRGAVRSMIREINSRWGAVDVLINNAGIIEMGPIDTMTADDFDKSIQTHFWGPFNCMQEVIPAMRSRHAGRIVNIASIGGKVPIPHLTTYCAGKFALVGLSESMANELAQQGITLTTICPGLMRTGSHRNAMFKGQHRSEYAWFSIAGALPLASMSADAAANQIIAAIARGSRLAVIGLPAKCLNLMYAVMPQFVGDAMASVNRFLPSSAGAGSLAARGAESHSSLSPSVLTSLSEAAAVRNNELD